MLARYEIGVMPDRNDRELVKAAVIQQMKKHPHPDNPALNGT